MNAENMRRLADVIEGVPDRNFGMRYPFVGSSLPLEGLLKGSTHKCKTAACIAGYACVLAEMDPDFRVLSFAQELETARDWLELGLNQSAMLFAPRTSSVSFKALKGDEQYITRQHAVRMLRRCADAREVCSLYWAVTK